MQCRICLGVDRPETMISPCNCRGTAGFIHQSCLDEYCTHFPDRICRVCQQRMRYSTNMDSILTWLFLIWGLMMIYFSSATGLSKIVYVITLLSLVGVASCQQMFTSISILSVVAIGSLFLVMEYESIVASIIILAVLSSIYTMGLYISPQNMLIIISILLVALYSTLFGFVIATKNDPYLMAYYFTFMFLIWNCITNIWHPPPRLV